MEKIKYVGFIDGSAKPNPGFGGCGYVIYQIVGDKPEDALGIRILRGCNYLGDKMTNNTAEYYALLHCIVQAFSIGIRDFEVVTDSEHLYKSFLGEYKVKNDNLLDLLYMIRTTIDNYKMKVSLVHSKKENNDTDEAHDLANWAVNNKKGDVKKIERVL